MKQVSIRDAKSRLSRLVDQAAHGMPFIIARAGEPLVMVVSLNPETQRCRRMGFLAGEISVPDDFDQMGAEEIRHLFNFQL